MPTDIEWTHMPGTIGETWNPINATRLDNGKRGWHCEPISPGCKNCYAGRLNTRNLPMCGTGLDYTVPNRALVEIGVHADTLDKPLRWTKPRTIFVCSMTDLFADFVTDEMIDRVFAIMALCPQHRFIVLTKRAKRMRQYFAALPIETYEADKDYVEKDFQFVPRWQTDVEAWPLPNLILGVSVENQHCADERIPELLETPAACRFLSVEPMLGPVDLSAVKRDDGWQIDALWGEYSFDHAPAHSHGGGLEVVPGGPKVDWVVCGGESGPGARPMHPNWARALRDQCQEARVPFFFKQWGAYSPYLSEIKSEDDKTWNEFVNLDGSTGYAAISKADEVSVTNWCGDIKEGMVCMERVGKKKAGRLLDGREWSEFPKMPEVRK